MYQKFRDSLNFRSSRRVILEALLSMDSRGFFFVKHLNLQGKKAKSFTLRKLAFENGHLGIFMGRLAFGESMLSSWFTRK